MFPTRPLNFCTIKIPANRWEPKFSTNLPKPLKRKILENLSFKKEPTHPRTQYLPEQKNIHPDYVNEKFYPLVAVTLYRSPIGCPERVRKTLLALGLKKRYQTIYHKNNKETRGSINAVKHLIYVKECDGIIPGTVY